ncbi:ABC transporter substrate-binding protein [Ornithinibacillus sp. 4-3]|uniref:ABC transporter substrate-binding protein n=1 Tax=Ornithinibacillus sp. 4-3 TaxID=3231488 RepID=A0AB39HR27_9BACI
MKQLFRPVFIILLLITIGLTACGNNDDSETEDIESNNANPNEESVLNIALDATPATMDIPRTAATTSRDTGMLMFETLVTTDADFEPIPMLAEKIDISEDNKNYIFHLRQGIKFHNGKEMKAEDVIASMERWAEVSSVSGELFKTATWSEIDEYTVELELASPSSLTLNTLATAKAAPAIMPKEIVDAAPAEGIEEYVGTGPYQLEEWRQDQYIHFTKHEEYQAVDLPATGLGGKKEALVDNIYFHLVSDSSTRLAGLQSGEYDFAYNIPYDNYELLQNTDGIDPILIPGSNMIFKLNLTEGIVSNPTIRKAINYALDYDEVMMAAFPNKDFYWLDPSYMHVDLPFWKSDAGSEHFNQNNQEKAKELLEEAGYDGEEIKIMATRDYEYMYTMAVVLEEQLQRIGMNTKLEVFDWPTKTERQADPTLWDIFPLGLSMVSTPPQLLSLSPTWAGGIADNYITDQIKEIENAASIEESREIWEDLQAYNWDYLPVINLGGTSTLYGISDKVQGLESPLGPLFWNVTIEE